MPLLLLHHLQTSHDPSALLLAARLRWMRHLLAHHAEHGVLAHTWYGQRVEKYECWSASMVATTAWVQDTAREQPHASQPHQGRSCPMPAAANAVVTFKLACGSSAAADLISACWPGDPPFSSMPPGCADAAVDAATAAGDRLNCRLSI